jgi:hypothetical protein
VAAVILMVRAAATRTTEAAVTRIGTTGPRGQNHALELLRLPVSGRVPALPHLTRVQAIALTTQHIYH